MHDHNLNIKINKWGQEKTDSWWQWILEAGPGVCARRYKQAVEPRHLWAGEFPEG